MNVDKYRLYPWVIKNLNFIALWVVFGLVYIANVHSAEKKLREMDKTQKEIEELRRAYINVKDKSLYEGTMYQIVQSVEDMVIDKDAKIPIRIKKGGKSAS